MHQKRLEGQILQIGHPYVVISDDLVQDGHFEVPPILCTILS